MMTSNPRKQNSDVNGYPYTDMTREAVWAKALLDREYHPEEYRRDKCGALLKYADFGNRESEYGWEIDHIKPVALGGSDYLYNLQPLHWKHNAVKGDDPDWECQR